MRTRSPGNWKLFAMLPGLDKDSELGYPNTALDRLNLAGVELDVEALQAENHNYLRNPSKYVMLLVCRLAVLALVDLYCPSEMQNSKRPGGAGASVAATVGPGAATDPETMEKSPPGIAAVLQQNLTERFMPSAVSLNPDVSLELPRLASFTGAAGALSLREKAAELLESVLDRSQVPLATEMAPAAMASLGMNPKQVPPDITPLERQLRVATSRRVVEELMLMMLAAGGKFVKEESAASEHLGLSTRRAD
ncbi:hypothetical protein AK812_SmicGene19631 [Symbiodinium microadriaticum]|uniref:Uncharacterized protein n=1 Tax=Symbiodinium microadriaticum TaxID=2951 RepID=A0A1Q9DS51_SYMMI|nr:hypothetical protein AK812_SmicGene19631 [Symbiodinium microadriaticum]